MEKKSELKLSELIGVYDPPVLKSKIESLETQLQAKEKEIEKERRDLLRSYSSWLNVEYDPPFRFDSADVDKFIKEVIIDDN